MTDDDKIAMALTQQRINIEAVNAGFSTVLIATDRGAFGRFARAIWDVAMQQAAQICVDHCERFTRQADPKLPVAATSLYGMAEGADACAEAIKEAMNGKQ